jgi:hypothetical protein
MHPETFAIGTAAALALAFLRIAFSSVLAPVSMGARLLKTCTCAGSAALLTFLISAPIILPFCEFIANGVSYKFSSVTNAHIEFVDIFTYFSNLSVPLFNGSPCIGPVPDYSRWAVVAG